ncbi:MAG: 4-hydroxybenzoyl-CoA reductase subunit beta [Acidobacteria bacterium]|nr:MAG: 4-hydroxybenzoyl-CoA reductase subunit beta [Acidobacteriota bacterium]
MSLPAFKVLRPRTLDAVIETLGRYGGDVQMVAGGTDLIPSMRQGLFAPQVLLDLKGIRNLDFIRFDPEQGLGIGALARISALVDSPLLARRFPVLHEAAKTIASPLLRNMGTLGGNLCLDTRCLYYNQSGFWRESLGGCIKKDGKVCHVAPRSRMCWAAFSGDTAPALLALGATVQLAGPGGSRELPLAEFYVNDGLVRMAKGHDEILTAVRVPASSAGWSGAYKKLRIRQSIDYPLAGVAVVMRKDADGACLEARVALTAVNPAPKLVQGADLLKGRRYDPALAEEVARDAIRTGKPLRTSASTMEYRRHMVRVFVRRALSELWLDGRSQRTS